MASIPATHWDSAVDATDVDKYFAAGDNIELLLHQSQASPSETTALAPYDPSRPKCRQCGQGFSKKSALVRHQQTVCSRTKATCFNCPFCGKSCSRKDSYIRHIEEKHGGKSDGTRCPDCGKALRPRVLEAHKCRQRLHQGNQETSQQTDSPGFVHSDTMLDVRGCVDPMLAAHSLFGPDHFNFDYACLMASLGEGIAPRRPICAEAFDARQLSFRALRKALECPMRSNAVHLCKAILCQAYIDDFFLDDPDSSQKHFNGLIQLATRNRLASLFITNIDSLPTFRPTLHLSKSNLRRQIGYHVLVFMLQILKKLTRWNNPVYMDVGDVEDLEASELKTLDIRMVFQRLEILPFILAGLVHRHARSMTSQESTGVGH